MGRSDDLRAGTAVRCPAPHRVLAARSAIDGEPVDQGDLRLHHVTSRREPHDRHRRRRPDVEPVVLV